MVPENGPFDAISYQQFLSHLLSLETMSNSHCWNCSAKKEQKQNKNKNQNQKKKKGKLKAINI